VTPESCRCLYSTWQFGWGWVAHPVDASVRCGGWAGGGQFHDDELDQGCAAPRQRIRIRDPWSHYGGSVDGVLFHGGGLGRRCATWWEGVGIHGESVVAVATTLIPSSIGVLDIVRVHTAIHDIDLAHTIILDIFRSTPHLRH
jgi:hypothetical protein